MLRIVFIVVMAVLIGLFGYALCKAAGEADDAAERYWRERDNENKEGKK